MAYDFGPRFNPMQGVSMQDLLAAKTTPVTQFAQAMPPLMEALMRRRQMMQQQQATQQLASGIVSGSQIPAAQLAQAMQMGLLGQNSLENFSPMGRQRQQAEIENIQAQAEARRAKAKQDEAFGPGGQGYVLLNDPFTGSSTRIPVPNTTTKDGRPLATITAQQTRADQMRDLFKMLGEIETEGKKPMLGQEGSKKAGLGSTSPANKKSAVSYTHTATGPNNQKIGYNSKTKAWEPIGGQ